MEYLHILRQGIDHNYWARDRQLQACALLSVEQFLRPVGGSFPSLRDTLAHMVAAEWLWLQRWKGVSPKALLPASDFPTLEVLAEQWHAVEREFRAFLPGVDEEALARPLSYINLKGEKWSYPLWQMIAHVLNHQSYHRGQVATQLRMIGVHPPQVDLLLALDMGILL
jgi:uncharacterized damage-inducible protein DinB